MQRKHGAGDALESLPSKEQQCLNPGFQGGGRPAAAVRPQRDGEAQAWPVVAAQSGNAGGLLGAKAAAGEEEAVRQ